MRFSRLLLWSCVSTLSCAALGCSGFSLRKNLTILPQKRSLDAQVAMAQLHERRGEFDKARQGYLELVKSDPKQVKPLHRLAVLSAKQGQAEESARYFSQAIRLEPDNVELLSDQGYALLLQGRLEDAEVPLRAALTKQPNHRAALNNLGIVLGYKGKHQESLAQFRKAGSEADACNNLAFICSRTGDLNEAKSLYSRALTMNPEHRRAAEALVQIESSHPTLTAANNEMLASARPLAAPSPPAPVQSIDKAKANPAVATKVAAPKPTEEIVIEEKPLVQLASFEEPVSDKPVSSKLVSVKPVVSQSRPMPRKVKVPLQPIKTASQTQTDAATAEHEVTTQPDETDATVADRASAMLPLTNHQTGSSLAFKNLPGQGGPVRVLGPQYRNSVEKDELPRRMTGWAEQVRMAPIERVEDSDAEQPATSEDKTALPAEGSSTRVRMQRW